jgi:hypothetical protein
MRGEVWRAYRRGRESVEWHLVLPRQTTHVTHSPTEREKGGNGGKERKRGGGGGEAEREGGREREDQTVWGAPQVRNMSVPLLARAHAHPRAPTRRRAPTPKCSREGTRNQIEIVRMPCASRGRAFCSSCLSCGLATMHARTHACTHACMHARTHARAQRLRAGRTWGVLPPAERRRVTKAALRSRRSTRSLTCSAAQIRGTPMPAHTDTPRQRELV